MTAAVVAAPMDQSARVARLQALATLLDSRWKIPGTGVRIGLDGIASILPVIGDSATGIVSAYLILEASRAGAPRRLLVRMAGNAGLDWLIGSIPVLGTLFDIGFKANNRNVAMLRRHLEASQTF